MTGHLPLSPYLVDDYLTSWRVPANDGWQPKVTLRQILSQSSGLTVHGFPSGLDNRVRRFAEDAGRPAGLDLAEAFLLPT